MLYTIKFLSVIYKTSKKVDIILSAFLKDVYHAENIVTPCLKQPEFIVVQTNFKKNSLHDYP